MAKIENFTDLEVWKQGHLLVIEIYTEINQSFPKEELFGLSSQMKRAAVSITSNIAEGFSRKGKKEKIQFFYTSRGSLVELQDQLMVARDVGYLTIEKYEKLAGRAVSVHKLLNAFITSTKTKF